MTLSTPLPGHAPGLPAVTRRLLLDAVMAGLLMPLLDADLADRELPKLEAKAAREAKKRAEDEWHLAWLMQEAAHHDFQAADTRRLIASELTGTLSFAESADMVPLRRKWVDTIDAMMRLPAPHARALRWKQAHATIVREWTRAGRAKGVNPRWAGYIAADVARFGKGA